jgi:hypothetical protein
MISLIYLGICFFLVGVIIWLLLYLINDIPLSGPFYQVARILVMVIGILIVIVLLLNFVGLTDIGEVIP